MKNKQYANQPGYSARGHQVVAVSSVPGEHGRLVTPNVGGVPTPFILVDSALAAGFRHIDDGTPTLDEILQEQTIFTFDVADDVRQVIILPIVEHRYVTAISGTAGTVTVAHEIARVLATINPGTDVISATRLANEMPDCVVFPAEPNHYALASDVPIQRVGVIARRTSLASPLTGGARICVWGVSHA